jgi:hypothetical protein
VGNETLALSARDAIVIMRSPRLTPAAPKPGAANCGYLDKVTRAAQTAAGVVIVVNSVDDTRWTMTAGSSDSAVQCGPRLDRAAHSACPVAIFFVPTNCPDPPALVGMDLQQHFCHSCRTDWIRFNPFQTLYATVQALLRGAAVLPVVGL